MAHDLVLRASDGTTSATAEIAVVAGGRLRQLTVERDTDAVELLTRTPEAARAASTAWGSFPMAPWAGRIRHGRFRFRGENVGLELNHDDGTGGGGGTLDPVSSPPVGPVTGADRRRHSIHGTTFSRPWSVVESTPSACTIDCPLTGALGWPYSGVATQRLVLHPDRIDLELIVAATDDLFPASIGWHPWFAKPDRIEFHPLAMYAIDEIGLPTGELVTPSAPPWDDCFISHEAVRLRYERDTVPAVTVSSSADHWVIYDLPTDATCVEPQSGPPDAPNLCPQVVSARRPLRLTMTIAW